MSEAYLDNCRALTYLTSTVPHGYRVVVARVGSQPAGVDATDLELVVFDVLLRLVYQQALRLTFRKRRHLPAVVCQQ